MTALATAPDLDLRDADAHFRQTLTTALLSDIVERVARRTDLWEPLVDRHGAYARMRLPVPEDVRVEVVTTPTFDRTRLATREVTTAFTAVRGVITEIRPDATGRLLPRKFGPGLTGVIEPGEPHALQNESAGTVVTIRAYSSR